MSLQMVLRHETGGFTGKFQVRRTAWLAQGGDFRHGEPGKAGAAGFQKCFLFAAKLAAAVSACFLPVWATMSSCSAGVYTCCKNAGRAMLFSIPAHITQVCANAVNHSRPSFSSAASRAAFSLGRRPSITARSKVFSALPTAGPGRCLHPSGWPRSRQAGLPYNRR